MRANERVSSLTNPALLAAGGCMLEEERLILLSPTALLYLTWSFERDDMLLG